MSRSGWIGRASRSAGLAVCLTLAIAAATQAQEGPAPNTIPGRTVVSAPAVSAPAPVPVAAPGVVTITDDPSVPGQPVEAAQPLLPAEVQIVRFHGPEGVKVEVLAPAPEPVPTGDGKGLATFGFKVGTGYRLKLSNLPNRAGAELFPVIEVVGHLHRPNGIDPAKFPIRIAIGEDDIEDVVDRGRLVTQVIYLEDPENALPLHRPKDEPTFVTLNPAEEPLKVGAALGRVMAIVRLGGRLPIADELQFPQGDGLANQPCPFMGYGGEKCSLPCGPVCGTPPPSNRPWMPRDEFLCDGGDFGMPVHFGGYGGLRGIDPRDTVIRFNDTKRDRALPTNLVCVYAPRFAGVRTSVGPNEAVKVQEVITAERRQKETMQGALQGPKKLNQKEMAETARHRARASGLAGKVYPGEHSEIRVLSGYDTLVHVSGNRLAQKVEVNKTREKAMKSGIVIGPQKIKSAETAVVTGIIEGAGQTVMTWTPREIVGVEEPEKKPGLAVIKQVDASEAEPGDVLNYTIRYRNMGNTPIKAVSVVDSLLPRLEYVPGSAKGPARTVFTAKENRVGSVELRWDLPGDIPPGGEGYVSFQAKVR